MTLEEATELVGQVPHWHHAFEIYPGLTTPGSYDPAFMFDKLELAVDLQGLRVLDIGTSDGFFALRLARRGADVTAIDYRPKDGHGYHVMERLNDVRIDYRQLNIYDIGSAGLGQFDVVLLLGVLYHLPDMMRALHIVRQACRGTLYLETHSENAFCPDIAAARYYSGASLADDHTNFWSPNRLCVLDMLHDTGFDVVRDENWAERLFAIATAVPTEGIREQKMRLGYGVLA